jgi:hypothetical protein
MTYGKQSGLSDHGLDTIEMFRTIIFFGRITSASAGEIVGSALTRVQGLDCDPTTKIRRGRHQQ